MNQCVPSLDLGDNPATARHSLRSNSNSTAPYVPILDYAVAELTWENGQLAMHGLGPSRVPVKPLNSSSPSKYSWDKPRANGTLESIVNQATSFPYRKACVDGGGDELVPWLDKNRVITAAAAAAATVTMDALVPCSNRSEDQTTHVMESIPGGLGGTTCVVGCSTRVGSCSGPAGTQDDEILLTAGKRARPARVPVTPECWSSKEQSASGSATFGKDHNSHSQRVTVATSLGSHENTSSATARPCNKATTTTTADDHDYSVSHTRPQREAGEEEKKETGKSSVSTKRTRAAAIHNQSERKRRDKINQRMKTLQKLVPNSSKVRNLFFFLSAVYNWSKKEWLGCWIIQISF
ncbi:hypothetical protein PTKIN_Ptkin12aG0203300 [Pterospermum kingtungense]